MKFINILNQMKVKPIQTGNLGRSLVQKTEARRKKDPLGKNLILSLSFASLTLAMPAIANDTNVVKQLSSLEQRFLGHSFDASKGSQSLEKRVARIEKLVFGEAKEGAIESRIKSLSIAVNGASVESDSSNLTSNSNSSNTRSNTAASSVSNPSSKNSESVQSASKPKVDPYPRIGALEKAIIGNVYPGEDIAARLARMEDKSFGKRLDSEALSDRTDALQKYIEKKTHKKLFVPPPNTEVANGGEVSNPDQPKRSIVPGLINAVSTTLFGPAGGGTIGGINTGMMGFGGIRVRNRADVQREELARKQQEEPEKVIPVESPLVRKPSPPPAGSKMKTKIGWCEVQLYGRTFPTRHLTQRLEQINGELEYKPGTKGINLMDDVDSMMKLVYSKNTNRTASTVGQKKTH